MKNSEHRQHVRYATHRFINMLGLFALFLAVSACGGGSDGLDGLVCTTEARTSVVLTVVDQVGTTLPGVAVSYQVNGGPALGQVCDLTGVCQIAFEVSGVFAITASKAG